MHEDQRHAVLLTPLPLAKIISKIRTSLIFSVIAVAVIKKMGSLDSVTVQFQLLLFHLSYLSLKDTLDRCS